MSDEDTEDTETGPSWAWDFALPVERRDDYGVLRVVGSSVLIEQRAEEEADDGTTLFVASTDSPDRAMDVVRQDWRLKNFRANPVILDNHNPIRVVGAAASATVPKSGDDAGKLMIRVRWNDAHPDPAIRGVGADHRNGFRKAGSVGFRAGKRTKRDKLPEDHPHFQKPIEVETWWGGTTLIAGTLFEQNELLEFSSATIPMNAEALQRSVLGDPATREPPKAGTPEADLRAYLAQPEVRRVIAQLLFDDTVVLLKDAMRSDADFRRIVEAYPDAAPRRRAPEPQQANNVDGDDLIAQVLAKLKG